eukprot:Protomagalhaensia_sp_Gyna_25__213@NODE_10_length_9035_cov_36_916852_g6_i2_p4_GENE_NODE_10_length_9035_cov_36_916852_g6_i2NODE_10_length_9035_cov_36_916852_g6_i2_p4_ORF_typecomplete_len323_score43_09_NODE_10_length_9035_cov_36_916852_g6_i2123971
MNEPGPIHQGLSETIDSYYDRFNRRVKRGGAMEPSLSLVSSHINDSLLIPCRQGQAANGHQAIEAFIAGIRVPRQREFVFYSEPSTLEEAFQVAAEFETCQSRNRRPFPTSRWGNLTDLPSSSSSNCPPVSIRNEEEGIEAESIYRTGEVEGSRDGLHRYLGGLSARLVSVGAAESTLSDFGVVAAMLENDWILGFQKAIVEDRARRLESLVEKRAACSDTETTLKIKGGIKAGYAAPKTTHLTYRMPNPNWSTRIAARLPSQMSIWCEALSPGPLCKAKAQ